MDVKRLSRQTCRFLQPPGVVSFAAVAGKLEGEGPLGGCFDAVGTDAFCGKKTWEQGEAQMQSDALRLALQYVLLCAATGASLPFAGLWFRLFGQGAHADGAAEFGFGHGRIIRMRRDRTPRSHTEGARGALLESPQAPSTSTPCAKP